MTPDTEPRRCVADVMVTCPKIHGAEASTESIVALFEDDHVHIALIVGDDWRLLTTIERSDLVALDTASSSIAARIGTLDDRTIGPHDSIETATTTLRHEHRRRLAVVRESGELLGLLCLNRNGTGYCSDENIRAREAEGAGGTGIAGMTIHQDGHPPTA
jgi:CBS-domain-containing membrane protein